MLAFGSNNNTESKQRGVGGLGILDVDSEESELSEFFSANKVKAALRKSYS